MSPALSCDYCKFQLVQCGQATCIQKQHDKNFYEHRTITDNNLLISNRNTW